MYGNCYYSSREGKIYLKTWDDLGKRKTQVIPFSPYYYIETYNNEYDCLSIFNTKVIKRTFKNSYERYESLKDGAIKRVFNNVSPEQQYLIDRFFGMNSDESFYKNDLSIHYLDIEVYSPTEFPDPKEAKHPINLITIYSNLDKKFYTWGNGVYVPTRDDVEYFQFASESKMLEDFIEWFSSNSPDIMTGWNTEGFDTPYIINRINRVFGDDYAKNLSPYKRINSRVYFDEIRGEEKTEWTIYGVSLIDYMDVYKMFARSQQESYSLDYISSVELNEGKLNYSATNLAQLSEQDWKTFVDYNIKDVDLVYRLDKKLKYLNIIKMLSYRGLCNFESALGKITMIAGCLIQEALKENKVFPTFNQHDKMANFAGGFVKEPKPGLFENIVSYDANSLYPNTIITLNISPETKIGRLEKHGEDKYVIRTVTNKEFSGTKEKIFGFLQKEEISISKSDVLFSQKKMGIIPKFIDNLYKERVKIKNEMLAKTEALKNYEKNSEEYVKKSVEVDNLDNIQYCIKIFLNSIYGAFGNRFSPLADVDAASSVTLTGQESVKKAGEFFKKYAESIGITEDPVQYMDTDSVYLNFTNIFRAKGINLLKEDGGVTEEAYKFIKDINVEVNKSVNEWAKKDLNSKDPRYVFKRESICDAAIFLAKKRYIIHVIDSEGIKTDKTKYVGVEISRSSTPRFVKELIKSVIAEILKNKNSISVSKKFIEVYETYKTKSVDEIAFRSGVNNLKKYEAKSDGLEAGKGTPSHVKGVMSYNYLLEELNLKSKYDPIHNGTKVKKVYLSQNKFGLKELCYPSTWPTDFGVDVDYEIMFQKMVEKPLGSIFDAIGWDLNSSSKNTTLDLNEFLS